MAAAAAAMAPSWTLQRFWQQFLLSHQLCHHPLGLLSLLSHHSPSHFLLPPLLTWMGLTLSLLVCLQPSLEFQGPPNVMEHQAFMAIMEEIVLSPILTISHVPRSVRPLLAETLATELRLACSGNVWGAVRVQLFAKAVLRTPPAKALKRHLVMASLIYNRLQHWYTDRAAVSTLWREAVSEIQQSHHDISKAHSQTSSTSESDPPFD